MVNSKEGANLKGFKLNFTQISSTQKEIDYTKRAVLLLSYIQLVMPNLKNAILIHDGQNIGIQQT